MINKAILVGRITKDPELKMTQSNIPFVNFTLAIDRTFTDQSGERQADFIQCVVWRKQAENVSKYVSKGSLLGIEGRIQTRQYEVDGQNRYATEVVCDSVQFLESKAESEARRNNQSQRDDYNPVTPSKTADDDAFYETSKELAAEEDLPF
ncbi:MAG: single-stranded DNA-binding protein [Acholeplasmataceae bacterium]|nr:single-stranded DNA-binding protein [Acholeplasmataceae bacterium]